MIQVVFTDAGGIYVVVKTPQPCGLIFVPNFFKRATYRSKHNIHSITIQLNSHLGLGLNLNSLSSIQRVDRKQVGASDDRQTDLSHLALLLSLKLGKVLALLVLVDGLLDVVENQVHELIPPLQGALDLSASDLDNHSLVLESRQIQNRLSLGEFQLLGLALVLTLALTLVLVVLLMLLVLTLVLLILVLVVSSMMASVAMTASASSSLMLAFLHC